MLVLEGWLAQQWESLRGWSDRLRFRTCRADYYEYLSSLIEGMQGRRNLHDIFVHDAARYAGSPRGRLSGRWSRIYSAAGGDLYSTWFECFPVAELAVIRVAQQSGNDPLVRTLADLADALRLLEKTRRILVSVLWSPLVALALGWVMVLSVPLFTVPRLQHVFSALPTIYYGGYTRALFDFSEFVRALWLPLLAACAGLITVSLWSLPNLTGLLRRRLDRHLFWRVYRYLAALRFLAVLTVVLARDDVTSTRLRAALSMQRVGSSRWQGEHIDAMVARIDAGLVGPHTFDTGLLDRELYWFFCDMAYARGMVAGLVLLRERLKRQILVHVVRQAHGIRWVLLLACVGGLLGLGLWHYAVIDELRRSLMLFYASQ